MIKSITEVVAELRVWLESIGMLYIARPHIRDCRKSGIVLVEMESGATFQIPDGRDEDFIDFIYAKHLSGEFDSVKTDANESSYETLSKWRCAFESDILIEMETKLEEILHSPVTILREPTSGKFAPSILMVSVPYSKPEQVIEALRVAEITDLAVPNVYPNMIDGKCYERLAQHLANAFGYPVLCFPGDEMYCGVDIHIYDVDDEDRLSKIHEQVQQFGYTQDAEGKPLPYIGGWNGFSHVLIPHNGIDLTVFSKDKAEICYPQQKIKQKE